MTNLPINNALNQRLSCLSGTAKQSITEFVEEMQIRSQSQKTIEAYVRNLIIYFEFLKSQKRKPSIDLNNIKLFQRSIRTTSPSRKNQVASTFKTYLNYFKRKEEAEEVIIAKFTKKVKKRIPIKHLINLYNKGFRINRNKWMNLRNKFAFGFFVRTACRISEACKLKWSDMELDKPDKKVILGAKGKDRKIPILFFDEEFDELMDLYRSKTFGFNKDDFVFLNKDYEQLSTRGCRNIIYQGFRKIGQNELAPHDIRRAIASYLLEDLKKSVKWVQQFLGHSSIASTQRYLGEVDLFDSELPKSLEEVG